MFFLIDFLEPDQARLFSGMLWIQTVCKGNQHATKVATSRQRVKTKTNEFLFCFDSSVNHKLLFCCLHLPLNCTGANHFRPVIQLKSDFSVMFYDTCIYPCILFIN